MLAAAVALAPTAALAEYRLQSGDALEIAIAGVPALKQRSQIDMEGRIAVPLAGSVKVAGLTVAAAQAKIARDLSAKVYHEANGDGRDIPHLILPDEITVTVAEYRPVYVNGDVVKPGEYQFRPGITVRQAVSLAGGYGLGRLGVTDPFMQAADLRADYAALWTEFAREQARSWRLRADLGEPGVKYASATSAPPPIVNDEFMKAEAEQRKARFADREQDVAFLKSAIDKANAQLNLLSEKKKEDEQGNRADVADFEKMRDLSRRGLVTVMRLSEARRVALISSHDLLQTIVDMSNIERQRGDYVRELTKLTSQERAQNLRDMQDTEVHLAQISARLKSTGEKLAYTGILKSQLAQGLAGATVITVYRRGEGGAQRLTAKEDLELEPGDVVDVAVKNEQMAAVGASPKAMQ